MEEWKIIEPWPDGSPVPREYEISTFGRVRRIADGFEPKQRTAPGGALTVFLTSLADLKMVNRRVAHLVAQAYLAGPQIKIKRVRHKDGNLANCRLDNLEIHSWTLYDKSEFNTSHI